MKSFVVAFTLIAVATAAAPAYFAVNQPVVFHPVAHHAPHHVPAVEVAAAHPAARSSVHESSKDAKILRYDSESNVAHEGYKFVVETSDGQQREEQAHFENAGTKDESLVVIGRFLFPGLKGEIYETNYIADKDGFRAEGAHIPKPVQPEHH